MRHEESPHDNSEPVWLHKHAHEPNPEPPSADPSFALDLGDGVERTVTTDDLAALPQTAVADCYIVSTGHGTSGPFTFRGVRLSDFVRAVIPPDIAWRELYVISADGFGNRVLLEELSADNDDRPILLATHLDGRPLTRGAGLVRLIVPSETDDALRQVKWIGRIEVRP